MKHLLVSVVSAVLFVAATLEAGARPDVSADVSRLDIDAREFGRGILHARLRMPVRAGRVILDYPRYLPGTHGPTGPIAALASLRARAGSANVPWSRETADLYRFAFDVPAGATMLDLDYDYAIRPSGDASSSMLGTLSWNTVAFAPQGVADRTFRVAPTLRLPQGWHYASALRTVSQSGDTIAFAETSFETLVDSPVLAGANLRRVPLGPNVELDAAADDASSLQFPASVTAGWARLVRESDALFGARHFARYKFLLALSDNVAHFGLEHHESSDDRLLERAFVDADLTQRVADLLPHEYVHSWNGKYRRPLGIATATFNEPIDDELLWVYEGLTNYYGQVLSFRSGLRSRALLCDFWANQLAALDTEPGRAWRPLGDTATFIAEGARGAAAWESLRRGGDYYPEGSVLWFEADRLIRMRTNGARSLDDMVRMFEGPPASLPRVVPYTRADVVAAMNAVTPYDWDGFFRDRVDRLQPRLTREGLRASGRDLVYSALPSKWLAVRERTMGEIDARYSIGAMVMKTGTIASVAEGSPAARAGIASGSRILAVGGWSFSPERFHAALAATQRTPIVFAIERGADVTTVTLDYRGGEKYPHLARIAGRADTFDAFVKPRSR